MFDITSVPYKIVAKYRNNEIKPVLFPSVIFQVAKEYNNPYILVEVNDIGDSIAATLNYDLEYPNVLMCAMRGRAGQVVGQGFSGTKTQLGVKMSITVKKIGCANLKAIIEEDKLLFNDFQIFQELTTFVQKKQAWEADEGYHDDLVMCMVLFAWLVMQDYFKEMTDQDIRRRIYEEQKIKLNKIWLPLVLLMTVWVMIPSWTQMDHSGTETTNRSRIHAARPMMDIGDQFSLEHLLFKVRRCKTCNKLRSNRRFLHVKEQKRGLPSAYSYECKDCTIKSIIAK